MILNGFKIQLVIMRAGGAVVNDLVCKIRDHRFIPSEQSN